MVTYEAPGIFSIGRLTCRRRIVGITRPVNYGVTNNGFTMMVRTVVLVGTIALLATGCSDPTGPAAPLLFTSLSAGGSHTCGLAVSGEAYCWGLNVGGQLGVSDSVAGHCPESWADTSKFCTTNPIAVSGGMRFRSLTAGREHTCGVTEEGIAYCWGTNVGGQLGVGEGIDSTAVPLPVTGGLRLRAVSRAPSMWRARSIAGGGTPRRRSPSTISGARCVG